MAPLTLVQAFAAGSLALSIPVAARLFGLRVHRDQLVAIGLVAVALLVLPIGFAPGHPHLHPGVLIAAALTGGAVAAAVARVSAGAARAVAAGLCYGIADAAIKAAAVGVRAHGIAGLPSGWILLAAVATFGGFLAFQSALRRADAVTAVSLMNALTAVTALGLGLLAFGESLGTSPALDALHVAAIAVVLACVRPLARAQVAPAGATGLTGAAPGGRLRRRQISRPAVLRAGLTAAAGTLAIALTLAASVTLIGLLYELRRLGWFAAGPPVPDALPLLQLAGLAGQPLARVLAAGLLTGAALGALLIGRRPSARATIVALTAGLVLLLASDASDALARNLRFWPVATGRAPGLGPWLEALLLAAGAVLPLTWPAVAAKPSEPRPTGHRSHDAMEGRTHVPRHPEIRWHDTRGSEPCTGGSPAHRAGRQPGASRWPAGPGSTCSSSPTPPSSATCARRWPAPTCQSWPAVTQPRWRWPPRWAPTRARSTPTPAGCSPPIRRSSPTPAYCRGSATPRCSRFAATAVTSQSSARSSSPASATSSCASGRPSGRARAR